MPVTAHVLNSAAPHTGTKASDTTVCSFRTHYLRAGRLPHADTPAPICSDVGPAIRVQPSAYAVWVERTGGSDSYGGFHALLQVGPDAAIDVPYSGEGAVVGIIRNAGVQPGAITSSDGSAEAALQFLPNGHTMTDQQLRASLAPDWPVRIADVTSAGVSDGPLAMGVFAGGVDMQGSSITGLLPSPADPTAAVSNAQLQGLLTQLGSSVVLTLTPNGGCFPHRLSWTSSLSGSGFFTVLRNGVAISDPLPESTLSYTDYDFVYDEVFYQVRQLDTTTGQIITSNTVGMVPEDCVAPLAGDYGDGADGALVLSNTTHTLQRGQVYRYSSVVVDDSTLRFTGNGGTVIYVDGDLSVTGNSTLQGMPGIDMPLIEVMLSGTVYSLLGGHGAHGSGGSGGDATTGGQGGAGGAGTGSWGTGQGGAGGYTTVNMTAGGLPGSAASMLQAGGGGGGGGADTIATGGKGGNGGVLSGLQPGVFWLVRGAITLDSSVTIDIAGATGSGGIDGNPGGYNATGPRYGGTGGGGGGAGGADGAHWYFCSEGAQTVGSYTALLSGGNGGPGGDSLGQAPAPGSAGTSGTAGAAGSAGAVQFIAL
ncbi:hypothetical protein H6771_02840 [Candidatus Peribacteria bacterium]|nr:hypothetical protein [Candidatus Peribacteria bacterium]